MSTESTTSPPRPSPTEPRLFSREHLPVFLGVLALVTLGAFENRALMSILPTVVRELDGWALFGAATGGPLVTLTVVMAYAGQWSDRSGPRRPLLVGVGLFVLAQTICGSAVSMGVFVAGRAVSGAAEALMDTALTVAVARIFPEPLWPKVFAWFAAAWILPSVLGPAAAGFLYAFEGWRAVFLAPLSIVPVGLLLIRGSLGATFPSRHAVDELRAEPEDVRHTAAYGQTDPPADSRQLRAAFFLAGGLGAMTVAGPLLSDEGGLAQTTGLALVLGGLVVLAATAIRVLPSGTFRFACGVPGLVALRFVVALSFTGIGSTIPLMLVQTQGVGPAVAGTSLGVTGVLWATGSWLNSTSPLQRVPPAVRLRLGHSLMAIGGMGPVLLALGTAGLVTGMLGWGLAALGMGLISPTLTTEALARAADHGQGRASAALGLASSVGVAVPTGITGAIVALRGAEVDGSTFALLMGASAAVALVGAAGAGRTYRCR